MKKGAEYLEWDSEFFGQRIGRAYVNTYKEFTEIDRKDFDLVYVFSSQRIDELDWALKDEKCVLQAELKDKDSIFKNTSMDVNIVSFDPVEHSYEKLLALVYESGFKSRFKVDMNFRETGFKELYKKWLDNSLSGHFAIDTLIALYKGEIMGFLTYNGVDDTTVNITLTAVDPKFRGKKTATILIHEFKKRVQLKGYKYASVITQYSNEPAMYLYQKNLFKINTITYIYHIWNHDTI